MEMDLIGLLKVGFILLLVYLIWDNILKLYYKYWYYSSQGIPVNGGLPVPFFGNVIALLKYSQTLRMNHKLIDFQYNFYREKTNVPDSQLFFNLPPITIDFRSNFPQLCINDPTLMTDVFVTKNKFFDKSLKFPRLFHMLKGQAIGVLPSNELWKGSRKTVQQMFYKAKLESMVPQINQVAAKHMKKWKEARNAPDYAGIDLFKRVHIMLVDTFSQCIFSHMDEDLTVPEKQPDGTYITKTLGTIAESLSVKMFKRATSPSRILFNCFDHMIIGAEERLLQENVTAYRNKIRSLIREKKKKIEENQQADFHDIMHLLLTNEFYANDEDLIVDQCIGLLAAGTLPATALVINLVVQSMQHPEIGEKIRAELQEKFFNPADLLMGADCGQERLSKLLTLESLQNIPYLNSAINESLRINPPTVVSSPAVFTEDVEIGPYTIKAQDEFIVNVFGLHCNPREWIEPEKFIPERFDPSSKYFLTPAGKKRSPHSFAPFYGGARSCLGQVFAENMSKVICLNVFSNFTFGFRDELLKTQRIHYHTAMTVKQPVNLDIFEIS